MTSERGETARLAGPPLTEGQAEEHVHGICFKTGPPGQVGVELEWLVCDSRDPARPVEQQRVARALARLDQPGALPGRGRLTTEPGGQVELSSAPASGLGGCVAAARSDLAAVRQAIAPAGLSPRGAWPGPAPAATACAGSAALRGHGGILRPDRPVGPGDDVQHRVGAGVRGRGGGPERARGLPLALAPAARARPRPGGRVRQLPVPGRPPVRLEIDPAGRLVPPRPGPHPRSGQRRAHPGWATETAGPRTATRGPRGPGTCWTPT